MKKTSNDDATYGTCRRFPKREHLCRNRDVGLLFAQGRRTRTAFPLHAVFHTVSPSEVGQTNVRVLISAGKRKLRKAVDRNRAKRQMREAWRLNKHLLAPFFFALPEAADTPALLLAFVWISPRPVASAHVQESMVRLLGEIAQSLRQSTGRITALGNGTIQLAE